MFFIIECGLYYQSFYSTQTFNDEVNSNLALFEENICTNTDDAVLDMVKQKTKRYFGQEMQLNFIQISDNKLLIQSDAKHFGKNILSLNINCNENSGLSTETDYLFRGPFLFRAGQVLSSTSSAQSPKF